MLFYSCLLVTLLIVSSYCDDLQDLAKNVEAQIATNSFIANAEKVQEFLHQKCLENADEEAYQKVEGGREEMIKCLKGLISAEELKEEMDFAKPVGSLDDIFKKYCDKIPRLKSCIFTYIAKVQRCFSQSELTNGHTAREMFNNLSKFVCARDGDRIALFVSEGGPECLSANQGKIQQCVNSYFPLPSSKADTKRIPEFAFNKEKCDKIKSFKQCIVNDLETCEELTTANMVSSVIDFALKPTPCTT